MFELPKHATLSEAAAHPHKCDRIGVSVTGKRSCDVILKHAITPTIRNIFAPQCYVVLNTKLWYRCRTGQFHETLAIFMISRNYLKITLTEV